jgi:hypothetical protein
MTYGIGPKTGVFIIVIVAMLMGSCYRYRYRTCMETRHDQLFCEIYAKG